MEKVINCTTAFVFDVDGTLTSSSEKITQEFSEEFLAFCKENLVFITSGASYSTILQQLGNDILNEVEAVYSCNGNTKTVHGTEVWKKEWSPSPVLYAVLGQFLEISKWKDKFSNTIDCREAMINFSTIGRNCTLLARKEYAKWDNKHKERENICNVINTLFPDVSATIGGQISIDIAPKNSNKAVLLDDNRLIDTDVIFFGNKMQKGGNDYPLAERIRSESKGQSVEVNNWLETCQLLRNIN